MLTRDHETRARNVFERAAFASWTAELGPYLDLAGCAGEERDRNGGVSDSASLPHAAGPGSEALRAITGM